MVMGRVRVTDCDTDGVNESEIDGDGVMGSVKVSVSDLDLDSLSDSVGVGNEGVRVVVSDIVGGDFDGDNVRGAENVSDSVGDPADMDADTVPSSEALIVAVSTPAERLGVTDTLKVFDVAERLIVHDKDGVGREGVLEGDVLTVTVADGVPLLTLGVGYVGVRTDGDRETEELGLADAVSVRLEDMDGVRTDTECVAVAYVGV